eukprot:3502713-Pleurochrysis_carterae.AAC.1
MRRPAQSGAHRGPGGGEDLLEEAGRVVETLLDATVRHRSDGELRARDTERDARSHEARKSLQRHGRRPHRDAEKSLQRQIV